MTATTTPEPFSTKLEGWLSGDEPKTLGSLGAAFGDKAFPVTIMLLMFVPALPLPTGGISHVLEVIAVLVASQMVLGRRAVWLPERWVGRPLGPVTTGKAIPFMTRWIHRFERISKGRGGRLLAHPLAERVIGAVLIADAVTALMAPPFSGLDTLPGLGAVVICLGLILGDLLVAGIGCAIGIGGAVLILTLGAAALHWLQHLVL